MDRAIRRLLLGIVPVAAVALVGSRANRSKRYLNGENPRVISSAYCDG